MVLITKCSKIQSLYENKIAKVKYVFLKSIYFISEYGLSLKVVTGTEKLSTVIEGIQKTFSLNFIYSQNKEFKFVDNISPEFITILISKPIIFYAKKGSLNGSHHSAEFINYSTYIYYSENLETLRYLKSLSEDVQKKIEIKWVIIDVDDDVRISSWLDRLIFLDFWQEEREKKITSGNIDYQGIEAVLKDLSPKKYGQLFMKKFIKYVTYPLLRIKPPQFEYVYPKLQYIKKPSDILVTDDMNNNVYRYECCICGKKHFVVMTNSKNKKKPSSKNMIAFDVGKNCIEFKCNHEDTEFKGNRRPYFKPDKVGGFFLKESKDYDKAFLYLFERYQKADENINFMHENGTLISRPISQYLES